MTRPRLSVGLPVYNGERYVGQAIEALLGQTYQDFELIISDNASTDRTEEMCREYAAEDRRIRYVRQTRNLGAAPNHNLLIDLSRGELFKWASADDLYARDLLKLCVDALDADPGLVLTHSYTAIIDDDNRVVNPMRYGLATASESASERFRSLLFGSGGDDDGGVIRLSVLRRTPLLGSYLHSDRTIVADLALHGRFHHVPDWLYFRRDHPGRIERSSATVRSFCVTLDPRRADRRRHPAVRLVGEYPLAYLRMIDRAPLSSPERWACRRWLAAWAASRCIPIDRRPPASYADLMPTRSAAAGTVSPSVETVVAGQERAG
ncbi:MAG TPA: glycosyltransferase family A protein [Kineosporiaceae bacterium]